MKKGFLELEGLQSIPFANNNFDGDILSDIKNFNFDLKK